MKTVVLVVSALAVLLGALWLVQGLGLVELEPILCVADCAPVQGASATWAVAGLFVVAAGTFGIVRALKRRPRR